MSKNQSKLWGGRFELPTNELVEKFNATILIEKRLFPVDINGSIAHATMLAKQSKALFLLKRQRRLSLV
ncbi:hypothetical protein [Photobacterium leiognathi]|uniref:hypothetical protein n=1 Tax=Photobacterium leiognathi TaxID=553611 RepID=UPI001EDFB122|nr:hypothetical protein [Photobacterium leiognathi]